MDSIAENIANGEIIAIRIIETILNLTEHNAVTLSHILGISLKKLVLKQGFSTEEVSMIVNIGNSLSIN